jgi:hypothetical protein
MEEPDDFELVLDFCIDRVYISLRNERSYLWEKLIDTSFGDDITEIMSTLYVMKAKILNAYRKQKEKPNK